MLVSCALVVVVAAAVVATTRTPGGAPAGVAAVQVGADVGATSGPVAGREPATERSRPPVATLVARVVRVPRIAGRDDGRAPVVRLDVSRSTDPDGDRLTFGWDLDGDGRHDDGTRPDPRVRLAGDAPAVVSVRVADGTGLTDRARLRLPVGARGRAPAGAQR